MNTWAVTKRPCCYKTCKMWTDCSLEINKSMHEKLLIVGSVHCLKIFILPVFSRHVGTNGCGKAYMMASIMCTFCVMSLGFATPICLTCCMLFETH